MKMHPLTRAVHVNARIVDAEAAHRQQALAMPSAGAASAAAPSAEPPSAAAAAAAMQGSTAQRSGHLAPPGGHAEAAAAAPAGGRRWQGGGTIAVGLRLAGERLLQVAELIGAAVRRALAWRPAAAAGGPPSPRRAGGPPPAAGMGRPPHIPSSPERPQTEVAPNATRSPTP